MAKFSGVQKFRHFTVIAIMDGFRLTTVRKTVQNVF